MGARSVLPGLLLIIAAVVLLALVSFNTPLLKQLYFLEAKFEDYILKLGTLGYCLDTAGKVTCQGPQVGYEFGTSQSAWEHRNNPIPRRDIQWRQPQSMRWLT